MNREIAFARAGKMMLNGRCGVTSVLLCALAIGGCAQTSAEVSGRLQDHREIESLLKQPTPDHLATASVLETWFEGASKTDRPLKLIEQAEALAPRRPELVGLQLGHCLRLQCAGETQIEDHLKQLDPENGFAWIPDLQRAEASAPPAERWWPVGSAQREALLKRHRQLHYLLAMSSRMRWWHLSRDMAVRLDAARQTDREEDVDLALVKSMGLPTEPPADWKDTFNAG
jgi:hypothetical protein